MLNGNMLVKMIQSVFQPLKLPSLPCTGQNRVEGNQQAIEQHAGRETPVLVCIQHLNITGIIVINLSSLIERHDLHRAFLG